MAGRTVLRANLASHRRQPGTTRHRVYTRVVDDAGAGRAARAPASEFALRGGVAPAYLDVAMRASIDPWEPSLGCGPGGRDRR